MYKVSGLVLAYFLVSSRAGKSENPAEKGAEEEGEGIKARLVVSDVLGIKANGVSSEEVDGKKSL